MRSATLQDRHLSKVNPLYGRSLYKMDVPQTGRHLSKADIVLSMTDRHLTYSTGQRDCSITHVFHACKDAMLHAISTQNTHKLHTQNMRVKKYTHMHVKKYTQSASKIYTQRLETSS